MRVGEGMGDGAPARVGGRALAPRDRLISLLWALPFLIFLAYPILAVVKAGISDPVAALSLAESLALGAVYIATWLILDPAPTDATRGRRFLIMIGLLTALQIAMAATVMPTGSTGMVFMLCYVVSPIAILSPPRWMLPGLGLVFTLAAVETLLHPAEGLFPLLIIGVTTTVCVLARLSMDHGRRKDIEAEQNLALSAERERTRISADLHDILGQTLTGITVKADLAGRLLDAGRLEDARAQIDDLQEMSRSALADVRGVVSANRTLLPATELDAARAILTAAGIRLDVFREGEPAPGTPSTLVAHAIREGCTNAYRHASPSVVTVTLRGDGVSVVNDGAKPRPLSRLRHYGPAGAPGGGNGLEGLRERVGDRGRLSWCLEGDVWTLDLRLDQVGRNGGAQ